MKKEVKVYLEPEDLKRLEEKARESGFTGRGRLTRYIEKICREPICFLDKNVRALLEAIRLKPA